MQPLTVVITQPDPRVAEALSASLQSVSRSVAVARSLPDLRRAIPKHRANVAVVDLETVPLDAVEALRREFAGLNIICTHRLADEDMWTSALAAGASDCCSSSDVKGIVAAAVRDLALTRSSAA